MELLYASPYSCILSSTRLIAHDYSLCMFGHTCTFIRVRSHVRLRDCKLRRTTPSMRADEGDVVKTLVYYIRDMHFHYSKN